MKIYCLKELTKENHTNAERQQFVKVMFSGKIDPEFYALYLWNQFPAYELLEIMAQQHGLLDDVPELLRSKKIMSDFLELWKREDRPPTLKTTHKYVMYLKDIMDDPNRLMAHVYVRHMGDLSGGQMIKGKVPGSGKMYEFADMNHSVDEMKNLIRKRTKDSMADEANKAFELSTAIFEELNNFTY